MPTILVAGGFTDWAHWSQCSVTCGPGIIRRMRTCTAPVPKNGGRDCVGEASETMACNEGLCPCKFKTTKLHPIGNDYTVDAR